MIPIPLPNGATYLPAYDESNASVKGVIVYNPSSNANPITVNGISIAPGGTYAWTVDEPETSLDPTTISINTGGQPVVVNYVVRNA